MLSSQPPASYILNAHSIKLELRCTEIFFSYGYNCEIFFYSNLQVLKITEIFGEELMVARFFLFNFESFKNYTSCEIFLNSILEVLKIIEVNS
ncbi:Protein of unknown function [Cotesia congregata]|uniref:Uncharacterized protein n=1 Tax=Cotesia congregata TaxID=51543 RepID=A0A8J2H481_COTCN|nr:Protein of unknown function [Cotesia congregata]